jgi:glycerophosphoryl diester phosphodiesterase
VISRLARTMIVTGLLLDSTFFAQAQMITAHRGASYDAPENTIAAFELAWKQGADAIEGDFYLSADNKIVCIHDKDTERTAGTKLLVESTSLQDLRTLEYGSWKDDSYRGEPIPTLDQVLATVPEGKTFVIELKSDVRIVPILVDELQRLRAPLRSLLIISFDASSIAKCKELLPNVKAHWLTSFKLGQRVKMTPTAKEIATVVRETKADGVGMKADVAVIDQPFINELIEVGCPEFHVWTIDDADDAKYFQSIGAMGITTNRPAFLRGELTP